MKKFFIYAFSLLIASTALVGCNDDEDLIFDDSAANRVDQAMDDLSSTLTKQGGKWNMEYFANKEEHGYNYVMTFSKDGTVKMSTNHEWTSPANTFLSETSLWQIKPDDGVVLSFDTYNPLLHVFASPDNYEDGNTGSSDDSGIDHTGDGHLGDYEFVFISLSDDGNTLTFKGKKHGHYIVMRRMEADASDEDFIAQCIDLSNNVFSSKLKNVYLNMANGDRYVLTNTKGMISAYPEGGDAIVQTETAPMIINPHGMKFMVPFKVSNVGDTDSIAVQAFVFQPDGTLLCDDANDKTSYISSGPLGSLFALDGYKWRVDLKNVTGVFDGFNDAVNEFKSATNGALNRYDFLYDDKVGSFVLQLSVRIRRGNQNVNTTLNYLFDVEAERNSVMLTYKGADTLGESYLASMPSLQSVLDAIGGHEMSITAPNLLATTTMVLTTSEGNSFTVGM